jgi:hypothetical protein
MAGGCSSRLPLLALPKPDALVMQGRKLVADRQQALLATLGANYLLLRWTLLARRRAMAKIGKQIRLAGPAEEEDLIGHGEPSDPPPKGAKPEETPVEQPTKIHHQLKTGPAGPPGPRSDWPRDGRGFGAPRRAQF